MDYILIHDNSSNNQWMYIPSTNYGICIFGPLETYYTELTKRSFNTSDKYHDIESYMRFAEYVNHLPIGSLYYDQPNAPYEYW